MIHRTLGRTGVKVSPLCLGAMMFGAWGNPDHDDSIRIIHRALDAGINFIDTADVYSRGESEEIVGKALAGGRRDDVVLATKVHGAMGDDPNQRGNSRRWIIREVEDSPAAPADRLDRPLPDPPPRARHRHRGDARRAHRPRPRRARSATSAPRPSRPRQIVEAQWVARDRGAAALRLRAAAVLDPRPRHRGRRAADLRALRHGRHPVEPARRRLALGPLPQGRRARRAPRAPSGCPTRYDLSLPEQPAQARRGRRARAARRRGRPLAHPARARLRHPPPGGHRGDHRPAHDGAARVPARRRATSSLDDALLDRIDEIVPPGTTINPADAGWQNPALEPAARRR